jgi:hypothetical protein
LSCINYVKYGQLWAWGNNANQSEDKYNSVVQRTYASDTLFAHYHSQGPGLLNLRFITMTNGSVLGLFVFITPFFFFQICIYFAKFLDYADEGYLSESMRFVWLNFECVGGWGLKNITFFSTALNEI